MFVLSIYSLNFACTHPINSFCQMLLLLMLEPTYVALETHLTSRLQPVFCKPHSSYTTFIITTCMFHMYRPPHTALDTNTGDMWQQCIEKLKPSTLNRFTYHRDFNKSNTFST